MLAWGIACALIETQRSGRGQIIDAAMCEGAAILAHGLFNLEALGEWQGQCAIDSSAPFYDVYQCSDDEWISVCPLEPQFYKAFIDRLGLAGDPDFAGKQYDTAGWPTRKERLTAIFKSAPRDHWNALFDDTDDCVWPVLTMTDAPSHPHNVAREAFIEVAGVKQPSPAPKLSRTPGEIRMPPPLLGEHSRERLATLGLSAEEIDRLVAAGVISDPIQFKN